MHLPLFSEQLFDVTVESKIKKVGEKANNNPITKKTEKWFALLNRLKTLLTKTVLSRKGIERDGQEERDKERRLKKETRRHFSASNMAK